MDTKRFTVAEHRSRTVVVELNTQCPRIGGDLEGLINIQALFTGDGLDISPLEPWANHINKGVTQTKVNQKVF